MDGIILLTSSNCWKYQRMFSTDHHCIQAVLLDKTLTMLNSRPEYMISLLNDEIQIL